MIVIGLGGGVIGRGVMARKWRKAVQTSREIL